MIIATELAGPPEFAVGDVVRSLVQVRNDGTYYGRQRGDVLIAPGEVGYVQDVGTFLQRYYIYSVDFFNLGMVVGMRAHELDWEGDDDESDTTQNL